ncbi:GNAT family N-acetyltransferase [uncultured Dokdonia sp.]|uniref:GNAT family N-acetyltransferase n=1 Tax=uncultured Dokdonia sp. TaxID=575653 RepID=UPI00260B1A91|nr:GNAT family N-acetyltransferase [uncultured Dokdonia sp.]
MNNIIEVKTKVYYLKMLSRPSIFDSSIEQDSKLFKLDKPVDINDYLFYYKTIGEKYNWFDRLSLDDSELYKTINSDKSEIYIYSIFDKIAGFAEFIRGSKYIEILYFGLLPDFLGKGLGKDFLSKVINRAWNDSPQWVQLNTCELDHPNALPTYKKLGFELDRIEIENRKTINSSC